jgi:hypothetical protein
MKNNKELLILLICGILGFVSYKFLRFICEALY